MGIRNSYWKLSENPARQDELRREEMKDLETRIMEAAKNHNMEHYDGFTGIGAYLAGSQNLDVISHWKTHGIKMVVTWLKEQPEFALVAGKDMKTGQHMRENDVLAEMIEDHFGLSEEK